MINPQWLELPLSRKISMVPKIFEPLRFDCNKNILSLETGASLNRTLTLYALALDVFLEKYAS